ncbi:FAD/NADP-binding domain-containing protein [Dacryopinax primogenitus]|uniref:FAD/NADP-binding domain-containing protein n=1 Tax=Dacryopinax primogenitus (strain DJM 731) TaxID=1858805 RepID=M5G192_DACPD|nr:FAD/NADP-binding domain-containing protein [Dacryopinax primogenitus]EJT97537.1 FAD/NADP-binding domain-containing protein [Dacryopinax primogenitus]
MAKDLPTHSTLGGPPPPSVDAGQAWFTSFSNAISSCDVPALLGLIREDGFWRDMLALTWDFRTFKGTERIKEFLYDRLQGAELSSLKLSNDFPPNLEQPWEDVTWLIITFTFSTKVGTGTGIARLVYDHKAGAWQAYTIYTTLWGLHGVSEALGSNRLMQPNHGQWISSLAKALEFEKDPEVLIFGAGQAGLDVSARLKMMGVSVLCVERNARVGDQWRGRYEALCLHDPVWYDHLPYLPFPSTWRAYTPAAKLAQWLEFYVQALELPIWLSSTVESCTWIEREGKWEVVVLRGKEGGGKERRVMKVSQVVYAAGWAGGVPNMPRIAGMDEFRGKIVHSTQHKTAKDYVGKKVLIIGAATSAHDIAHDFANHDIDVTIFQRNSAYIMITRHGMPVVARGLYWDDCPPTEQADMLSASLPNEVMRLVHKRYTQEVAEKDRELLEGLDRVGFRRNEGVEGSGLLFLAYYRAGGYYLDVGASQMIVDGKIGLKNGCEIDRFTPSGVRFSDGSEIAADLVVFATGFGDIKKSMGNMFASDLVEKLKPVWGVDEEGEIRAAWGDSGHEKFWYMMGNLCLCRFHSKHMALQIKAMQMGVFGDRYQKGKPS